MKRVIIFLFILLLAWLLLFPACTFPTGTSDSEGVGLIEVLDFMAAEKQAEEEALQCLITEEEECDLFF